MRKFELSLSENYVKTWEVQDAIREFFQNALDQETSTKDNKMFFTYNKDQQKLFIGNKLSILDPKTLLLGETTKDNDTQTIGKFGEGYKLATLVCLRSGHNVVIYNYGRKEVWRPKMVNSRRYGAKILTFFVEKFVFTKVPDNNLTIEINNITPELYETIKEHNLHLQKDLGELVEVASGRILLNSKYSGNVYVNGLYVDKDEKLKYGYDIKPEFIQIDRDRRMIRSFDLHWETSKMWKSVDDSERLYELIESHEYRDCEYVASMSSGIESISHMAYSKFLDKYGKYAIPVTSQQEAEDAMETYTNAKTVIVSDVYKELILQCKDYRIYADLADESVQGKLIFWFTKNKKYLPSDSIDEFEDIVKLL